MNWTYLHAEESYEAYSFCYTNLWIYVFTKHIFEIRGGKGGEYTLLQEFHMKFYFFNEKIVLYMYAFFVMRFPPFFLVGNF